MSQSSQKSQSQRQPSPASFQWLYAFWKFSRPHTIIGTSLSVLGLYLISVAVSSTGFAITQINSVLGTWLACLCG
ncbi:homogentisate phytyltransferase, partial [Nostoc sp. NIES-2111]